MVELKRKPNTSSAVLRNSQDHPQAHQIQRPLRLGVDDTSASEDIPNDAEQEDLEDGKRRYFEQLRKCSAARVVVACRTKQGLQEHDVGRLLDGQGQHGLRSGYLAQGLQQNPASKLGRRRVGFQVKRVLIVGFNPIQMDSNENEQVYM